MQISSLQPVFKLELNHKVTPGVVIIAKYDGTHPCLTASAGYDKIIIHHPHGLVGGRAQRSEAHAEVSELNLSQAVKALAAGPLKDDCTRDMLLIGSPTQILAYDVHENTDLFFKEVPDGVNVINTGRVGNSSEMLAVVGGNSSVIGLNGKGEEIFWNVVSGRVVAVTVFDFDKDGENELLIGCEDSFIRVMKNNQFMVELPETGSVLCLSPISDVRFAYGLANGTIGVYEEGIRLWRVKSKQNAVSLQSSGEWLVCCWTNGRVDWRDGTGRVVRRVQLRSNSAGMLLADYRSLGVPDLVCVSDRGEVLGYPPHQESSGFNITKKYASEEDRLAITELMNKKQALMVELQHYEANAAVDNSNADLGHKPSSAMPTNTRLQVAVTTDCDEGCIQLAISTNNETIVRAALILAEGVFETGETLARHPSHGQLRPILFIPLRPPRDVPIDVHIKALIGYPDSEQFHIFELTKHLPRFSMYKLIDATTQKPKIDGNVTFHITERVQRIYIWINQNFLLEQEIEIGNEEAKDINLNFMSLRDQSNLHMTFNVDGQVKLSTNDMRLAGDLIQSLATFLNLSNLQSCAHFPVAEEKLWAEMFNATEHGETRSRLAAESAEKAQMITALLPAAIDAASYDIKEMLNRYKDVMLLNDELLIGCHVRRSSQEQTVTSLKNLHGILQQAARLRVGKYGKAVVTACRKAVQDNNIDALIKILRVGDS
ncbi:Bardet-Biedl syndrome 2 protein isoform X1 [Pieris rapae]|uniref:Bardet-Biedl syndrome 2 protein isoform X1 n=1 Tax=Pieris rapae TaxID=64459 RepID=UPI001E27FE2E|nr:Bardet-Biedl syndrome 2 protein isoform X1 [Pieris rapae]